MTDLVLPADNISKHLVVRSPLQMDNLKDALEAPGLLFKCFFENPMGGCAREIGK